MPTPIGHALAGLAVAVSSDRSPGRGPLSRFVRRPLTLLCITLAVLPDADLLYQPIHRTVTHSVGATILVTIIAAAVTGWVTGRITWRIALVCGAAHASHLVTDWLGTDRNYAPYGIQMFWPFSDGWFISGWDVFLPVERRHLFSVETLQINVAAALRELAIFGTLILVVWFARSRYRR